jgi:hypothetical protein
MTEQEMLTTASKFSPYRCVRLRRQLPVHRYTRISNLSPRSLFMWYMWRIEDVDVSVMQT